MLPTDNGRFPDHSVDEEHKLESAGVLCPAQRQHLCVDYRGKACCGRKTYYSRLNILLGSSYLLSPKSIDTWSIENGRTLNAPSVTPKDENGGSC